MRRLLMVLGGVLAALGALPATAGASPAHATVMVREPEPAEASCVLPPERSRPVPREALLGLVSATALRAPDGTGGAGALASGGSIGVAFLKRRDWAPGVEARALFARDGGTTRVYDLQLSMLVSPTVGRSVAVPLVVLGVDIASVSVPGTSAAGARTGGATAASGVAFGVHGDLGLHGFFTDSLYWRGTVGYLGAGVGAVRADLALGYVFAD